MKLLRDALGECLPTDHSQQINCWDLVANFLRRNSQRKLRILDLGCGEGNSIEFFQNQLCNVEWVGIDIEDSPEVNRRKQKKGNLVTYDGVNIPFEDNYFDLIVSNQVFEHVRYPQKLLSEVYRVLKPKATFIGSTSHLEPFHSFSYWNYTPYGFKTLVESSNLTLIEIRPSIDALTLIVRGGLGKYGKFLNKYWRVESPLNKIIDFFSYVKKLSVQEINTIKLKFCGQFCFLILKDESCSIATNNVFEDFSDI